MVFFSKRMDIIRCFRLFSNYLKIIEICFKEIWSCNTDVTVYVIPYNMFSGQCTNKYNFACCMESILYLRSG